MEATVRTGEMHYQSRTRGLWHKGATSGSTQKVVSLAVDCDGDATQDARRARERMVAQMPMPATLPSYSFLMLDDSGNVWLGEYRPDQSSPRRYLVFGPDGRFLATVAVPERFVLMSVARRTLCGRATDELDVESVACYRIAG
jgi:hypothetical protein